MTEIASVQPLPWPAEKYIELADQFAQEAVQMRTTAMHILEQADRLSAASAELRKSAKFVDIPAAEELSQLRITTRRERVRIDPTQIRGFAQSYGDWFQMKQLQEVVPGSRSQLIRYVNELVEKGTLEARGYKRRRKYRFIKPEGNSGPFVAPRGEPSITQIRTKTTGNPVPHTKVQRPSGKPGADKKKAARGVRIRKRKSRGHS